MKRCIIREETTSTNENPFLLLPEELIDHIIRYTISDDWFVVSYRTLKRFAALLRFSFVNKAARTRFEQMKTREVTKLLEYCLGADTCSDYLRRRLSGLALSDLSYFMMFDAFLNQDPEKDRCLCKVILSQLKDRIHSNEYTDLGLKLHLILKRCEQLPRTMLRALVYHSWHLSRHNKSPPISITEIKSFTSICNTYVYQPDETLAPNKRFLVSLSDDPKREIDVRFLRPLILPLMYQGETLYAVQYSQGSTYCPELGLNQRPLSPELNIERLLKRVRETEAFRAHLLECKNMLFPLIRRKKSRSAGIGAL